MAEGGYHLRKPQKPTHTALTIPGSGHKKIKDPPTWLKVVTTLEKPQNPTHTALTGQQSNVLAIVTKLIRLIQQK